MVSVTKRINQIKQPRGGYVNPKEFEVITYDDGIELYEDENVHASLIGLAVDYLTRYMMGEKSVSDVFKISLSGAKLIGETKHAMQLLEDIKGLDDKSIINACKLSGYDVCFRAGIMGYRPVEDILADKNTISNIKIMVNRSLTFWEKYGPVTKVGATFEGGYTDIVSSGDCDYLTKDTLWDFKVSKTAPRNKYTLQLLMYYIMGCHSIHDEFQDIKCLGIYNPRLNKVYLCELSDIKPEIIEEVERVVIGYE